MANSPKLFTCPRCRERYLGHEVLPDCPRCGYDYRVKEGFRWDVLVYFLAIMGLMGFLLVSSYYRNTLGIGRDSTASAPHEPMADDGRPEKLPGSSSPSRLPFQSPYHEPGR